MSPVPQRLAHTSSRLLEFETLRELLAGYAALLSRVARQPDFVVGLAITGRTHVELQGLLGFFMRTVPARFVLSALGGAKQARES